jgi:hypothetical protein
MPETPSIKEISVTGNNFKTYNVKLCYFKGHPKLYSSAKETGFLQLKTSQLLTKIHGLRSEATELVSHCLPMATTHKYFVFT